jgi:hypothetical protein
LSLRAVSCIGTTEASHGSVTRRGNRMNSDQGLIGPLAGFGAEPR